MPLPLTSLYKSIVRQRLSHWAVYHKVLLYSICHCIMPWHIEYDNNTATTVDYWLVVLVEIIIFIAHCHSVAHLSSGWAFQWALNGESFHCLRTLSMQNHFVIRIHIQLEVLERLCGGLLWGTSLSHHKLWHTDSATSTECHSVCHTARDTVKVEYLVHTSSSIIIMIM